MLRTVGVVLAVALVVAGCGVRNSKPFTPQATAPCLKKHGFTRVTTNPAQVGFIAGFADLGGLRATSPTNNILTVAFTSGPDAVGSEEEAFRNHAPPQYKGHMSDIMQTNRNAVLVWTITPSSDELDAAQRCLSS